MTDQALLARPVPPSPFSVRPLLLHPRSPLVRDVAATAIDGVLALSRLHSLYAETVHRTSESAALCDAALDTLGVAVDVTSEDLDAIPATGPLVVVANHPFGAIDRLVLLSVLSRVRRDVRLLGNDVMHRIPELRQSVFFINPFGGPAAARRNAPALRGAARWIRHGHVLAVFPAGEVSHLSLGRRRTTDPHWHTTAARLARSGSAAVVPMFFRGTNSRLFQVAGLIHPRLRTLLLPREVLKRRDTTVSVSIGSAVSPSQVRRFSTDDALTAHVRARTYVQGGRVTSGPAEPSPRPAVKPLAAGPSPGLLRAAVEQLPTGQRLSENGEYSVWVTPRAAAPIVVDEIGRLRELTFRQVEEGTGRATDLDHFDDDYLHLFVWNDRASEIVGAYRLGQTDDIVPKRGARGLYTNTLFRFDHRYLRLITPALELGRSFVRPEYQREFAPLMLLWKGIGQFVAAHPRYARLFGPVSISRGYAPLSQQLIMAFLRQHRTEYRLAHHVAPRNPPGRSPFWSALAEIRPLIDGEGDGIDELVREVEHGRRGMPVLLRQYLKLNAKALAFNVDPLFGDALDALMVVDLRTVQPAMLQKYMGQAGAARFQAYHDRPRVPARPSRLPPAARPNLTPA